MNQDPTHKDINPNTDNLIFVFLFVNLIDNDLPFYRNIESVKKAVSSISDLSLF